MTEEDIVDLPALFKLDKQGKAVPYFPNMVRGVPVPWVSQKNSLFSQDESPRLCHKSTIFTAAQRKYLQPGSDKPGSTVTLWLCVACSGVNLHSFEVKAF